MKTWLLDTGPLVAYLDADDPKHAVVSGRWDAFAGTFSTTSAVITEAMYFVSIRHDGPRRLADLASASGLVVYDLTTPTDLREAVPLMEKYSDTPMDFADATLVLLAEALRIRDVFTLDRRGFSAYRTRPGGKFRLVLDE